MIVKDEEEVINRCLDSVKDSVDEINIVVTGSTDKTKEIAAHYTDRIFDFEWVDDFSKARNFAFQQASKEYIFWMDADDVLLEPDQKKLKKLKETLDPQIDTVTMDYHLAQDEYGNITFSMKRNRLVKRINGFRWIGRVHEYLEVWGNVFNSDIAVTHSSSHHDSERNLLIYEKQLADGIDFSPRELYYFANELKDHAMYERAIYYYEKFLSTEKGWIEDNISACSKLADCYFELGNRKKEMESIFRSFSYDCPRPEFCCRLGYHFLQKDELNTSIFWYELATEMQVSNDNLGFINPAYSTWLPHLQLCVCYDRLGDHERAHIHNELASHYRPNDPNVLHNRSYFETILNKNVNEKSGVSHD
jgi:glycosyltransferase involved in cell wall biosynthesis